MINVMIVEDHNYVRGGLVRQIDSVLDMSVVAQAETGEEAVRLALAVKPNVVLMDIFLPGMNGAEATRRIKRGVPEIGIVVLTSASSVLSLEQMRDAGARGFLSKKAEDAEVLACIRSVNLGKTFVCNEIALAGFKIADGHSAIPELSPREREILSLIIQGKRNKAIADHLCLHEKTVHTHKSRILVKLKLKSDFELARYAMEHALFEE